MYRPSPTRAPARLRIDSAQRSSSLQHSSRALRAALPHSETPPAEAAFHQ